MKRTVAMLSVLFVLGCGDDEAKDKDQTGDGDTGDGDTGDGDAPSDAGADAAASTCVDDSKDTVSNPVGFSCTVGAGTVGAICTHFIGTGWTAESAKAACEKNAKMAGAEACMNDGFCERKTADTCKIPEADKDVYAFGMPAGLCMFIKGTVVTKPAAGWPSDYTTLPAPAADGGI
jgi:hypothetical protein